MGAEYLKVAFFGSMTLLAREIRSALESRAFPAESVKLYDTSAEGTITEFAGEPVLVVPPDEEAIVGLDIAFMCGTPAETIPYLDWPARRGFVAIDLSGASRGRAGVPLIHSEINPGDIVAERLSSPVIGAPHAVSHNLASLVAGARAAGRISSLEALALRPAADLGEKGIDELYQQTLALLNFDSVPQDVFGRQVAFNIVPSSGIGPSRAEALDERIHDETVTMLGMEPGQASIASALVPMFHGHAMSVTLTFDRRPEVAVLKETIGSTRGLKLVEDPSIASPLDVAGEENVAVLEIRPDPHRPGRVSFWSFCDNLKGGAALNAVRIAERVADLRRATR